MYVLVCVRVGMWCVYVYGCMFMWAHVFMVAWNSVEDSLVRFELVTGDPDPIRIRVHWGPDTLAIRRPTHRMIQRFVAVRAVKTKWRFGFKFHVSICSYLFSYLPLSVSIYILLVSFHVTVWFILPVWLPVSLHEASVSVHLNYFVDLNDYQCHFMCW